MMNRPRQGLRIAFALLVPGLLALGCATGPRVYSNFDRSVDFSRFQTYGFFPELATDKPGYESLESSFLKVAVAQQMDRRGYRYSEDPQLLLNFYIYTKEKVRTRSVPTAGYYGYRDPYYDAWGGYGGYETQVEQYTEGTLNVDLVDAKTKKLVWEGSVVGRITDRTIRNLEAEIDAAVEAVFTTFPVQTGASD